MKRLDFCGFAAAAKLSQSDKEDLLECKLEAEFLPQHELTVQVERDEHGEKIKQYLWTRKQMLGKGSFGEVHHEILEEGEQRAVKELKYAAGQEPDYRELLTMLHLSRLDSELLVRLDGWWDVVRPMTLCIAMEYFPHGDLSRYIGPHMDERDARQIVQQLIKGVKVMHDEGLTHRDLKPANIMVAARRPPATKWRVKIGDFGISKQVPEGSNTVLRTGSGTPMYAAPEQLHQTRPYGRTAKYTNKVDIWSVGCIMFNLAAGSCDHVFPQGVGDYYSKRVPLNAQAVPLALTANGLDLLKKLLAPHPDDRPAADEALHHPWFKERERSVRQLSPSAESSTTVQSSSSFATVAHGSVKGSTTSSKDSPSFSRSGSQYDDSAATTATSAGIVSDVTPALKAAESDLESNNIHARDSSLAERIAVEDFAAKDPIKDVSSTVIRDISRDRPQSEAKLLSGAIPLTQEQAEVDATVMRLLDGLVQDGPAPEAKDACQNDSWRPSSPDDGRSSSTGVTPSTSSLKVKEQVPAITVEDTDARPPVTTKGSGAYGQVDAAFQARLAASTTALQALALDRDNDPSRSMAPVFSSQYRSESAPGHNEATKDSGSAQAQSLAALFTENLKPGTPSTQDHVVVRLADTGNYRKEVSGKVYANESDRLVDSMAKLLDQQRGMPRRRKGPIVNAVTVLEVVPSMFVGYWATISTDAKAQTLKRSYQDLLHLIAVVTSELKRTMSSTDIELQLLSKLSDLSLPTASDGERTKELLQHCLEGLVKIDLLKYTAAFTQFFTPRQGDEPPPPAPSSSLSIYELPEQHRRSGKVVPPPRRKTPVGEAISQRIPDTGIWDSLGKDPERSCASATLGRHMLESDVLLRVVISRDGRYAAGINRKSDNTIELLICRGQQMQLYKRVPLHSMRPIVMDFSPDGSHFALANGNEWLFVWPLDADGRPFQTTYPRTSHGSQHHEANVLSFSNDNRLLAVIYSSQVGASTQSSCIVWDNDRHSLCAHVHTGDELRGALLRKLQAGSAYSSVLNGYELLLLYRADDRDHTFGVEIHTIFPEEGSAKPRVLSRLVCGHSYEPSRFHWHGHQSWLLVRDEPRRRHYIYNQTQDRKAVTLDTDDIGFYCTSVSASTAAFVHTNDTVVFVDLVQGRVLLHRLETGSQDLDKARENWTNELRWLRASEDTFNSHFKAERESLERIGASSSRWKMLKDDMAVFQKGLAAKREQAEQALARCTLQGSSVSGFALGPSGDMFAVAYGDGTIVVKKQLIEWEGPGDQLSRLLSAEPPSTDKAVPHAVSAVGDATTTGAATSAVPELHKTLPAAPLSSLFQHTRQSQNDSPNETDDQSDSSRVAVRGTKLRRDGHRDGISPVERDSADSKSLSSRFKGLFR